MGMPKQKWTSEEEAALKAGVVKYGPGKWSTILKDSEFVSVLHLRSNVDLKDKWRNMHLMVSGCGSRQRGRVARPTTHPANNPESISTAPNKENDIAISIAEPHTTLAGPLQNGSSKMRMPRLDGLILDTIANLKQSLGSSHASIAEYIEDKYSAPPNFERLLKTELKALLDCGKLIKVKHRYRIAPSSSYLGSKRSPSPLLLEYLPTGGMSAPKMITKAEIDAELEKMKSMTPQEAAAVAMKAVAEAEAAILEAERAAKEAEAAEADAEIAKVFAAAAKRTLKQTALFT